MVKIAPSILSADFSKLGEDCKNVLNAGADLLHIDVMDGHFVPNISLGIPVLESLSKSVKAIYDVHLMITHPQKYAQQFILAGADYIVFHIEADCDADVLIDEIHAQGKKAGLAVKPNTPITNLRPFLQKLDIVLVMTVEPGFGGQSFMPDMMNKVLWLSNAKKENNFNYIIEVDGGVNKETAEICVKNGAEMLVAGSAVFLAQDMKTAICELKGQA